MRRSVSISLLFSAFLFVTATSVLAEEPVAPSLAEAAVASCEAPEEMPGAPEETLSIDEDAADNAVLDEIEDSDIVLAHHEEPCGEGYPVGNPWTEKLYCGSCGAKRVVRTLQQFCDFCRCVPLVVAATCEPC